MNKVQLSALAVFAAAFSVYLFTSVPAITQDDSGELAGAGATLGTAHPPGYPLYCLLSKALVTAVPFGNTAYRVNLASSLTIAAAGAIVFLICFELAGSLLAAAAAGLAFSFSRSVWSMANVTEVYGLAALIAALILFVMIKASKRNEAAQPGELYEVLFLFGLGLTAHYTIAFMLPGITWWAYANRTSLMSAQWKSEAVKAMLFSAAGFSAVLYIYLRAQAGPVFGWEDPKTLERFWQVIARLRYGTASLAQGGAPVLTPAMVFSKLAFYFSSFAANYTLWGTALFLAGLFRYWKDKELGWPLFAMFAASGPGFVLLANAGTDAASKELMERFFFLSFVFAAAVMAGGFKVLPKFAGGASLALPLFLLWQNFALLDHRQEYLYYDHAKNMLKTLPRGALLFSDRADEMEFAISYLHLAAGLRPDIKFIDCNAGATRSVYGDNYYRVWGKPRLEIRELAEKAMIAAHPGPVYYATFFPEMVKIARVRDGLLFRAKPLGTAKAGFAYDEIYAARFPSSVKQMDSRISALALSFFQLMGEYYISQGGKENGKRYLDGVSAFDRSGKWSAGLGFIYHNGGMTEEALACYKKAEKNGTATADVYANLGVIYEEKLMPDEALESYRKAIELEPASAQAHYNLAVLYWKQGKWELVAKELEKVITIDPSNAEAKRFLGLALSRKGAAK